MARNNGHGPEKIEACPRRIGQYMPVALYLIVFPPGACLRKSPLLTDFRPVGKFLELLHGLSGTMSHNMYIT
jgi:hypothetical protein